MASQINWGGHVVVITGGGVGVDASGVADARLSPDIAVLRGMVCVGRAEEVV